jgi:adenylate cyclase
MVGNGKSMENRRLAAVLIADIAGYTSLIEQDTDATVTAWKTACADVIEPAIAEYSGRIVKLTGDGFLSEFPSVQDAVLCAINMQNNLAASVLNFRMGVNLGDIVDDGQDIHGEGINIAARIEGLAEPGGICVSGDVYSQVRNRIDATFEDMGDQKIKHVSLPVRVYQISAGLFTHESSCGDGVSQKNPTVAILPFDNMSSDPEQEYFSDGITEDLITALSKHRWLAVVARNTTFGYKGRSVDIRKLAHELGADYVVEGSVRRVGSRVRITAQLIVTATGNHLWAERFDRELEDIFDVQDEITDIITARVEPEVGMAERQRVIRGPRQNLQAWDYYHMGVAHFYKFTAEDNVEAQHLLNKSRELDSEFGAAHAWWAYATILGMVYWDTNPDQKILDEALAASDRALELDDQNAAFYFMKARVQLARREYASALIECKMAISLNPTSASAICGLGDSLAYEGRYDEAIDWFEKAIKLSPNDPQVWAFRTYGALAFIFREDFETAIDWLEKAAEFPNCQYWTTAHKVVALAYLDRLDEANLNLAKLLAEKPGFTIEFAQKKLFYLKRQEQIDLYLEGLRRAGVPEK